MGDGWWVVVSGEWMVGGGWVVGGGAQRTMDLEGYLLSTDMEINGRRILDPNVPERRGERGRVLPVVGSKVGTEYEEHGDH